MARKKKINVLRAYLLDQLEKINCNEVEAVKLRDYGYARIYKQCADALEVDEDWYIPRKPKFTTYKRDCYIDNELVQSCFHPQNSNICGRCGANNCTRH